MSPGDLEKLIASQILECEIHVQGGEGKYHVSIVGDIFDGLNSVKRQQVYILIMLTHQSRELGEILPAQIYASKAYIF